MQAERIATTDEKRLRTLEEEIGQIQAQVALFQGILKAKQETGQAVYELFRERYKIGPKDKLDARPDGIFVVRAEAPAPPPSPEAPPASPAPPEE
jgi:hypothetical protein